MPAPIQLHKLNNHLWEIEPTGGMRVPARIYASEKMIESILSDNAAQQAANVAHLPGIVTASLAMPDIHWGYGFPIGGVAAFDTRDGVISPGGVGYDINCGVRMMAADLTRDEVEPKIRELMNRLFQTVPTGVGSTGEVTAADSELRKLCQQGAAWSVRRGLGTEEDIEFIEERGCIADADPAAVSKRAWERGREQVGTLGSGNHFLEVAYVDQVFDETAARAFGLFPNQITITIHCGSRGFGYQVCDDSLGVMERAARKYGIELPDRQLACAPVTSPEGRAYLGAMRCAVNYAFANRQAIAHRVRETFAQIFGRSVKNSGLDTVYEVAHNIAKIETHAVNGEPRELCVHRKGATRAFGPNHPDVPEPYRAVGQPVLVPGDMGRCSYVLVGTDKAMRDTFGSACHGAGRTMSRHKAIAAARGRDIVKELDRKGIVVRAASRKSLDEEIPDAYKNVSDVVDVCEAAGIATKVALLKPIGCIKG